MKRRKSVNIQGYKAIIIAVLSAVLFNYSYSADAFIDNGVGVRSTGMSGAFYQKMSPESIVYNPGILSGVVTAQAEFAFNKKWGEFDEVYLSFIMPGRFANVGLSYFHSQLLNGVVGTYYVPADQDGYENGKSYTYYNSLITLCLSKQLTETMGGSINLNRYEMNLAVAQSVAYAVDAGINYTLSKEMNLCLKVSNILNTGYVWSTETEKNNMEFSGGMGFVINEKSGGNIGFKQFNNRVILVMGMEMDVFKNMTLRCGYSPDIYSAGLGVNFMGADLAYSYNYFPNSAGILDTVSRFGFNVEL